MTIEPDTKDWTWVLERACEQCGYEAYACPVEEIAELIHDNTRGWTAVLASDELAVRPTPQTWSPLEYACHVRDVHRIFDERVALMLGDDDPEFPNWDQDATAVESDYASQDPAEVEVELIEAAAAVAGRYATVAADQWRRTGRRSNGSVFTVETLARYHLHDIVHHLYDVGS